MLQTVTSVPFHRLKRCQTALKTVKTAPFAPFSVPSDIVSDGETVNFLPSGASTPEASPRWPWTCNASTSWAGAEAARGSR